MWCNSEALEHSSSQAARVPNGSTQRVTLQTKQRNKVYER